MGRRVAVDENRAPGQRRILLMGYLYKVAKRLITNAPLRLQISSMVVSTSAYAVSIFLLSDRERGTLTAFLYGSYLIVGISFLGANTMIAHWEKGAYSSRLKLASYVAFPGLTVSAVIVLTGIGIETFKLAPDHDFGAWVIVFGAFVFVSTLGETIFAAKTSSDPKRKFWQHYVYFTLFLIALTLLVYTENLGVWQIVVAYIFASIPFFFTRWPAPKNVVQHFEFVIEAGKFSRRESAKLFLGTFVSNMHVRLVSLVVVAIYGPEYLGRYVVLWLAFEVTEQLYKFLLLTEVSKIRDQTSPLKPSNPWAGVGHVLRIGFPSVIIVAILVFLSAPHVLQIPNLELIIVAFFLTINYLSRLILNFRLNHLRATSEIGVASKISLANTALALGLVAVLPRFVGFEGVAIGISIATLAALVMSVRRRK